jgi:hypothetical protein
MGNRSSKASSEGSCVQPSMGIPFAIFEIGRHEYSEATKKITMRTFIHGIANWRIVDQTHMGKIRSN